MKIFKFRDYSRYLKEYIVGLPRKGRGEISKIAAALGVHTTLVSLVLSGERDLTPEQSYDLANYLNLTDIEKDFFSILVQFRRAGNPRLKKHLKDQLEAMREKATKVERHFEHEKKLAEDYKARFYSSWIYSAIRLYCTTEDCGKSVEEIADQFSLTRQRTLGLITFLQAAGLILLENDKYKMGVSRTYLDKESVHLSRHHSNWRIKAIQKCEQLMDNELMFTSPLSISREDFEIVREEISVLIKKISARVKESPAEEVACINIDLFYLFPLKNK